MAKILLVDDSQELVEFLSTLLSIKKYEVRSATSKQDILECVQVFAPDLILLDVKLGTENGREICKEIKRIKDFMHTPVILISANHDSLKHFRDYKADDAIEKPFEIQALLNKINRHLNERVYVN